MSFQLGDFIEIEFTGKTKEGQIFDSNIKEDVEKAKINIPAKPFVFCLGQGMFLKGIEDFLIGKDEGEYNIELPPEKAFGDRDTKLIQIIPTKVFTEQKTNPVQGAVFNFDGRMGKVLTSSGGRVIVDFNNPLAGKEVHYKIKVLRKVEGLDEKIKAFNNFLFKKDFKFEVKEKKLVIEADKQFAKFIGLFKDKYKEIFDLELEIKEVEEKKEENQKDLSQ